VSFFLENFDLIPFIMHYVHGTPGVVHVIRVPILLYYDRVLIVRVCVDVELHSVTAKRDDDDDESHLLVCTSAEKETEKFEGLQPYELRFG